MKSLSLTFKAGAGALESIRKHGFDISSVGSFAGASGGAKWLVLSQLDRAILSAVMPKLSGPIHLIGGGLATLLTGWWMSQPSMRDPRSIVRLMGWGVLVATVVSFVIYWTRDLQLATYLFWIFIPATR